MTVVDAAQGAVNDSLDFSSIDNGWKALTCMISFGFVMLAWWLTQRTKCQADAKAATVDRNLDLREVMPILLRLEREVQEHEEEIKTMRPIVDEKYPAAVEHIRVIHCESPDLDRTHPIPDVLRDDLGRG